MNYKIAPTTDDHIEGYCAAVASVSSERLYLTTFSGFSLESSRAFVLGNRAKGFPHFVALDNEKVIGWCDISSFDRPVSKHSGTLGIGILKPYRGQGIGKKLINTTIAAAKESGLTRVDLTVRENNTNAIALYKKVGFEIEGVLRNAIRIDGLYTNSIAMAMLFD
ncbi:MAG: GNAT family N-acetyltransferase [Pseudomonadota bacterium]